MRLSDEVVLNWRKVVRRFNWAGVFYESGKKMPPVGCIAGYTRSGTTLVLKLLSNVIGCRPIHEPLNPDVCPEISFFSPRESVARIRSDVKYQNAIRKIFSESITGNMATNPGVHFRYKSRLYKIVRGNFYLDYIHELVPGLRFVHLVRNPLSCIASRIVQRWPIPDYSECFDDIKPYLTDTQISLCQAAEDHIESLAVSWCLDNLIALRNRDEPWFKIVHFEDVLLDTHRVVSDVLDFYQIEIDDDKILVESRLLNLPNSDVSFLAKWKKNISSSDFEIVQRALDVFGFGDLYDYETSIPTKNAVSGSISK